MGNRLGLFAAKIEQKREELGLDEKGFRQDGTDPAAADKEAMEKALYERADARIHSIVSALGTANAVNTDTDEAS